MDPYYNQNYTKEQIDAILELIKKCIQEGRYSISRNVNRQENIDFINDYNLSAKRQKEILLKIKTEDFCHSLQNVNLGFEHEVLYVFCPTVELYTFEGEGGNVDIYIKFNIIDYESEKKVITISFHKRNKPIDYLFR